MASDKQIIYRDAFLGNIQSSARVLDLIRFPLVVTVNRTCSENHISAIKNILGDVYCIRGTIDIIAKSHDKIMIMFSDDQDAATAYQDLNNKTIQNGAAASLTFKVWDPMDDLGYDVADHHIYVSIQGLPFHLWNKRVVEQILHPYCALEVLSEETNSRRNLSSYTLFGWSEQRIALPSKISLKIMEKTTAPSLVPKEAAKKEVLVYTLTIDVVGFTCDEATNCSCNMQQINNRYESEYDPNNAQCFLTQIPDSEDLLEELQLGVMISADYEHHGFQSEEIQDALSAYLPCAIKVHRLNNIQFYVYPADRVQGTDAKAILMEMKCFDLRGIRFSIDHWKERNFSFVEQLPFRVSVTLNDIPAHLCTPEIIGFVLSPYCAMDGTNQFAQIMPTAESFKCTAWTNLPSAIPKRIMIALFTSLLGEEFITEESKTLDLRITQVLIDTDIIAPKPE